MPKFMLHPSSFILALVAGCLPLAVLTAGAFRELAAMPQREPAGVVDEQAAKVAGLIERSRAERRADGPAAEALLDAALFAPQPLPALESVGRESPLLGASRAWSQWLRVQEMIAAGRDAEQLATAESPDDLRRASARFAQLADKYRAALGAVDGPLRDHFRV